MQIMQNDANHAKRETHNLQCFQLLSLLPKTPEREGISGELVVKQLGRKNELDGYD